MFVYNRWSAVTGTVIYENTQELVSGLVSYATPYRKETGCRFTIVKRDNFIRKTDETNRAIFDQLTTQFGWDQLSGMRSTGIEMKVGRTRLQYDGIEYRAIKVDNFGRKFNQNYMPMGIVQVIFQRRVPVADGS